MNFSIFADTLFMLITLGKIYIVLTTMENETCRGLPNRPVIPLVVYFNKYVYYFKAT